MMKMILTLALFASVNCFADDGLDSMMSKLVKSVSITKTECTLDGQVVASRRLDFFFVSKNAQGFWEMTAVELAGPSASGIVFDQTVNYEVSKSADAQKVEVSTIGGANQLIMKLEESATEATLTSFFGDGAGNQTECSWTGALEK